MSWERMSDWALEEPVRCALRGPEVSRLQDVTAVVAALRAFADRPGAEGWVNTPDGITRVSVGSEVPSSHVLDAELAAGAVSMSVRHIGEEWLVVEVERTEGDSHWASARTYAAVGLPGEPGPSGRVTYEVYWKREAVTAREIEAGFASVGSVASRFVGFEGGQR